MPTFKSLKLAQHKADKPIRPKPTCLDWPVGPAELGLCRARSAVLPLLMGLIFHLIFTSQLLQKARLCRPDNKNRRVGEITIHINNHSVFKTQSRNSGLFNFIKELFFYKTQIEVAVSMATYYKCLMAEFFSKYESF